jgi:hypothetical protein
VLVHAVVLRAQESDVHRQPGPAHTYTHAYTHTHTRARARKHSKSHRYLDKLAPTAAKAPSKVVGGITSAAELPELLLSWDGSNGGGNGNGGGAVGWVPPLPTPAAASAPQALSAKKR